MSQVAYTAGQTAFTLTNLITRAQKQNPSLNLGTPDFLGAAQIALAAYAKGYAGNYYLTPSQTSAPTAFPAVQSAETAGSFYEIAFPADAQDVGIQSIEVLWDTSNLKLVPQANILNTQLESSWDVATSNTTNVYWRMAGRKIRIYLPVTYIGVAPKYALGYIRLPTYPGTVSDTLDVPAEDFATFYSQWVSNIVPD